MLTSGRYPAAAAPTPTPTIAASATGMSRTIASRKNILSMGSWTLPDIGQNFGSGWIFGSVGEGERAGNGLGNLACEIGPQLGVENSGGRESRGIAHDRTFLPDRGQLSPTAGFPSGRRMTG